ncbi:type II toxin-antitoxin system VapC family toxin [Caulobacter sp. UNC279MFTsu5.1]|uniref:type II toxin-antitoxin system VapC family toxin n=1 Tax=Caulobacter sp. UNC279MFTsu5.1 TaxID=1502775 RepID=UPI0008DF2652|nr:type II toxin-antitoxin system VapC family toxin [Caulobacter sp. UNC279MFTsu5.1]SFK17774.1 Predicted nucleic acid-binding protein, contains PIN domain [Caulobacter sp. UNC279MFTsu5.1]
MSDEIVLDASVAADWLLPGPRSAVVTAFMRPDDRRIAPDLIFAEFTSVAIKLVRRNQISRAIAHEAVDRLPRLIDEVAPLGALARPAHDLARDHAFSAYDAFYLALALKRGVPLVTADAKLARRAVEGGLARHVRLITPESRP